MIESAGILAYKILHGKIYVLLAHPGGPYCEKKEYGCLSIPKGAVEEGETRKQAARREFREETGFMAKGKLKRLGSLKTNKRKNVTVFATKMDVDTSKHRSNTFILEWPAKSGNYNVLLDSLPKLIKKKPFLNDFLTKEEKVSEEGHKTNLEEIF
jgi:predicted NUDIX family NTP pyrophosphohydrolase